MSKYTDLLNKMIAEKEYDSSLVEGAPIRVSDGNNTITIGIVREVFHDNTGLDGYVVENPETKELTVLGQIGSIMIYQWFGKLLLLERV